MNHRIAGSVVAGALLSLCLVGPAGAAGNQPPVACFTLTPTIGTVQLTFSVDASCSTDDKTPLAKLKVRWDWENDGVWDTAFSTTKTATHSYPSEGSKTIRVQVQDQSGLNGTTTQDLFVQPVSAESPVADATGTLFQPANEPALDLNPFNSQNVVLSAYGVSGSTPGQTPIPVYFSNDGGISWSRSLGQGPAYFGDPGLEFNAGGTVFASFLDSYAFPGAPVGVVVEDSADGGATFVSRFYAMDPTTGFRMPDGTTQGACSADIPFDYPKLGIDRGAASPYRDNLYVTSRVLFDLNGDGLCGSPYRVGFVRSRDGGQTWDSAQALTEMTTISSITVDPNGVIYLAGQPLSIPACPSGTGIGVRTSTDGGQSFGPLTCAYNMDGSLSVGWIRSAADPSSPGRVWIAFDAATASLSGSWHAYVIRTTDGGATWSAPVRVDDVLPNDVVDHKVPSVSISSTGRVDVAWFDYRNSNPPSPTTDGQAADIYYAFSTDGGLTWSPNLRASAATAPAYKHGNDFLTVVSAGAKALLGYSQDRDASGQMEAYFASLLFH